MLVIVIVLLVLTVIGFYGEENFYSGWWLGIGMTACTLLLIFLFFWGIVYIDNYMTIVEYRAIEQVIEDSKDEEINDFEKISLRSKVTDINAWLKRCQYWDETIWDRTVPDKIIELVPLRIEATK